MVGIASLVNLRRRKALTNRPYKLTRSRSVLLTFLFTAVDSRKAPEAKVDAQAETKSLDPRLRGDDDIVFTKKNP